MIDIWMSIIGISMALSGLPQIIKLYQRKSSKDISISLWILIIHGQLWWIVYGFYIMSIPLIITNIICVLFGGIIIFQIFYYKRK